MKGPGYVTTVDPEDVVEGEGESGGEGERREGEETGSSLHWN